MKRTKKLISMLLAILIVVGMIPMAAISAFAVDMETATGLHIYNPNTDRLLTGGTVSLNRYENIMLEARIYNGDGSYDMPMTQSWRSESQSVASVDDWGNVMAANNGTATVTVTCEDYNGEVYTASFTVKVGGAATDATEAIIRDRDWNDVTDGEYTVKIDDYVELYFWYVDAMGGNEMEAYEWDGLVWSSDNPDVVSITEEGKPCAIGEGSAVITGSYTDLNGYSYSASTTVVVEPYADDEVVYIEIRDDMNQIVSDSWSEVNVGESRTYTVWAAYGNDDMAEIFDAEWEIVDNGYMTLDENGTVTGKKMGKTYIYCNYTDTNGRVHGASTQIRIIDPNFVAVDHIIICDMQGGDWSDNTYTAPIGYHNAFTVWAVYEDGTMEEVTGSFSSDNESIIAANNDGNIYAKAEGSATVTATYLEAETWTYYTATMTVEGTTEDAITPEAITNIAINDIETPRPGCVPDYTYSFSSLSYFPFTWSPDCRNGMLWIDSDGFVFDPETDIVEDGAEYRLNIYLKAQQGYYFDYENASFTVTVNGVEVTETLRPGGYDKSGYICISVPAMTAEYGIIDSVSVDGLTYPVVGEAADFEAVVPKDANYTVKAPEGNTHSVNGIEWYDATEEFYLSEGDVFEKGHNYIPVIYLQPKTGYRFATKADGASAVSSYINIIDSGKCGSTAVGNISAAEQICLTTSYKAGGAYYTNYIVPVEYFNITADGCTVYNDAGNIVTRAQAGDVLTVTSSETPPWSSEQEFEGFLSSVEGVEFTSIGTYSAFFIMPESDITVTGKYSDIVISSVNLYIDAPVVGREADFTPDIWKAPLVGFAPLQTGFWPEAPEWLENSTFWYDWTDNVQLEPGDKFIAGHAYSVAIYIHASEYYAFNGTDTVVKISYVNSDSITVSLVEPFEDPEGRKWLVAENIVDYDTKEGAVYPYEEKNVNIVNGTAYNADGEVITKAAVGDRLTIVGNDPTGVRTFQWWYDASNAEKDVVIKDEFAETTVFQMNDADVTLEAYYTDKLLENPIEISLEGYYTGAKAGTFAVAPITEGISISAPVYQDGLSYNLYLNGGVAFELLDNGAVITSGNSYRLEVAISSLEGYDISEIDTVLLGDTVGTIQGMYYDSGLMVVSFDLPASDEGQVYDITTMGATALINGIYVTEAYAGAKIELIADETEEKVFVSFTVTDSNGDAVEVFEENGAYYFIMPASTVTAEAIYNTYITSVDIFNLTVPEVGQTPDYDVTVPEGLGYELYIMDAENTLNGVNWFAGYVNGEQVYASMIPGTHAFDYSGDYTVTIYLKARDGYKFKFNEDGQYHEVEIFVDGLSALHSTIEEMDGEEYMAVVMYFYTESPAYSITVEGGNAYDRGKTQIITSATEGAYVWAIADDAPEGQMFYYWEVVSGIYKYDEAALKNPEFGIFVGSEDVVIRAVYGEEYILGDVSGDGKVNAKDANILKRFISGVSALDDSATLAGDLNGDGKINGLDANVLSRIIAGKN